MQLYILPNIFKMDITLTLPVGRDRVERYFSQMKKVKTRLCSTLDDVNLSRLMRIAVEGLQLSTTDFSGILDIKETNLLYNIMIVVFKHSMLCSICSID